MVDGRAFNSRGGKGIDVCMSFQFSIQLISLITIHLFLILFHVIRQQSLTISGQSAGRYFSLQVLWRRGTIPTLLMPLRYFLYPTLFEKPLRTCRSKLTVAHLQNYPLFLPRNGSVFSLCPITILLQMLHISLAPWCCTSNTKTDSMQKARRPALAQRLHALPS